MKTIAISIEKGTLDRIDRLTQRGKTGSVNRSRVIREALTEYLARAERAAEDERERDIIRKHRRRLAREAEALVKEQARP